MYRYMGWCVVVWWDRTLTFCHNIRRFLACTVCLVKKTTAHHLKNTILTVKHGGSSIRLLFFRWNRGFYPSAGNNEELQIPVSYGGKTLRYQNNCCTPPNQQGKRPHQNKINIFCFTLSFIGRSFWIKGEKVLSWVFSWCQIFLVMAQKAAILQGRKNILDPF